ncbi:hypothetical protein Hdeb2414_s0014g00434181 [Helianthus debilis subsp. tardiflorus]
MDAPHMVLRRRHHRRVRRTWWWGAVVPGFPVTATAVSSRKWLLGCRLLFC